MAALRSKPARLLIGFVVSVVIAAVLVAIATVLRAALTPTLGSLSPFMIYVAAVLIAGLIRGPVCGVMVMLAGGACGWRFFLVQNGEPQPGAWTALAIFWAVAALVLTTANALRVHLEVTMHRIAAALRRLA